jgi:prepilin peptidase CpaA
MVVTTLASSSLPALALLVASIAILLAAALHDIATRTVPNWMAGLLALLGVASQLLHFPQYSGFIASLIVFLASAICWRRGWMGGGDVKLLAAASLVLPPGNVVMFIAAVALSGAVLAIIYLAARRVVAAPSGRRPQNFCARALRAEQWRIHRAGPLPYALAIAAGFLFITL